MGGEHSGIADDTTRVFLEGAFWNPAVIQGKMRRLGFASDAGYRFERGVDFAACARAVERATQLMLEICGGRAGLLTDAVANDDLPRRDPVRVRTARVARILGVALPGDAIAAVFTRLHFAFTRDGADFVVTPPSFRFDLGIEEDFIEEVARMHGYDAIPAVSVPHMQHMLPDRETRRSASALKHLLVDRDWQEIVTFSFVDSSVEKAVAPGARPVRVLNPIASQMDVMRTSLLPGLLETLQTNLNRKESRIRIFELGRTFHHAAAGYVQPTRLGGLAYGGAAPEQWGLPARDVDFYDIKGDLEALVAPRSLTTEPKEHPALHPGRSAAVVIDGGTEGWLGELHPRLVRHFALPKAPIVFELAADALTVLPMPAGKPVSRLPVVRRDLALVVDDAVPVQALLDALADAKPAHVEAIRLFDVYRGSGLTEGKKSLAILVLMQDTSRTLTDADIAATEAHLLAVAHEKFGAALRQ
jgi:phenylalanyl-tRNA synthetase beta chain